jgi:lipopolysaccharide biosynthesis regulator YciM
LHRYINPDVLQSTPYLPHQSTLLGSAWEVGHNSAKQQKEGKSNQTKREYLNNIGFNWSRSDDEFQVRCSEALVEIKTNKNRIIQTNSL